MTTAVILAAGRGTRLRHVVSEVPKGFLELGDKPIIEESIERLLAAGVHDILIVTGHLADHYERLALQYENAVRTVHNDRFAESGSMYSLYCAREHVREPFILLESDLIYEPRALTELLGHPAPEAILLSGPTGAGDEVYVETCDGFLVEMSKDPADLEGGITGELVGITKISERLFSQMLKVSEAAFEESLKFDYETDCLVAAGKSVPIACPLVDDLVWAEIDDENHLRRARNDVYWKLKDLSEH